MLIRIFILLLLSGLLQTVNAATALAPTEQALQSYVNAHQAAELQLLEKLVNINSGTQNLAGVRHVGDLLREQFQALGFSVEWVKLPESLHRADTLVATHQGGIGKRILLIGHLDTVFPKNSAFQRFQQDGSTITGPGVIDIKGGDVTILYALKALASVHALEKMNITVVLTGDEEDTGKPVSLSRQALLAAAQHQDVAIDFECGISQNTASVSRRGVSNWVLKTTGRQAHSAAIFSEDKGDGAIFEIVRILNTLREKMAGQNFLSFNPGIVLGGTTIDYDHAASKGTAFGKQNVIADTAIAQGDLRYLSNEQRDRAKVKMQAIAKKHLPKTDATLTFQDAMPAMPPKAQNLVLLSQFSQVSRDLGFGAVAALDAGARGAGDISFVADKVPANLVGLGPVGTGAHTEHETMNVNALNVATQRAAVLLYRLAFVFV